MVACGLGLGLEVFCAECKPCLYINDADVAFIAFTFFLHCRFREDHGKLSVICMGVVPPNCDAGSILNIGQAMVNYSDLVSLLIPASTTGRWGDEPLTTIGGAKARRAAAAKVRKEKERRKEDPPTPPTPTPTPHTRARTPPPHRHLTTSPPTNPL